MLLKTIMTRKEIKNRKKSGISCFLKSESAAATAIAAVLLLALVFTMIAVVKLEYVPNWKNDAERDHMYNTMDEMVGVKTNIDTLSGLVGSCNYPSHNISVTVPVDMGGGQIPFLEPSKSDGKLEVNAERYAMTIVPRSPYQKIISNNFTFECGGITCYSENRQYPDQIFRYENGALILANDKGSVMRQPPSFTIIKNETNENNYTVIIQAIQLSGKRDSTSSNTIIPLQLTGYTTEPVYDSNDYKNTSKPINSFNLTIATRYPGAWIAYFNEIAQDKNLTDGEDYTVQYLQGSGHVRFSFLPNSTKTLERLYISKATVGAELGTGSNFSYDHSTSLIGNKMKLKQWYCFNKVSDSNVVLSQFENYSYGVNFSVDTTDKDEILSAYSPNQEFIYNVKSSPLELTFSFDNYTAFESKPSSATIRMIYHYNFNPLSSSSLKVANNPLDSLNGTTNNWCLYNETTAINITNPSELTFYIKVDKSTGGSLPKNMTIDYLALCLN